MNDQVVNTLVFPSFLQLPDDKAGRILSAARREFAARGFQAASTNAIVRECGIAKGSLFNYFRGKEGLFLYLHWLEGRRQLDVLASRAQTIRALRHPVDRLAAAVELSLEAASADPEGFRFSLSLAQADAAPLVPRYVALFDEAERAELFGSLLFPDGEPPDENLARLLSWLLNGVKLEIQALAQSGADLGASGLGDRIRALAPLIRTGGSRD